MKLFSTRRLTAVLLVFFQLSMGLFSTVPLIVSAQTTDIDPPVIDFEAITTGKSGDSQVFAATVIDNVGVQSVKLFYRFAEDTSYRSRLMNMLGSSGIFTVTLDSLEVPDKADFVQYYVEASDGVGNRTLQGFAFDPIERQLVSATVTEVALAPPSEPIPTDGLPLTRKIIYGAVGLLIIGVLASASGGSSGGSGSNAGVPVTVVVDQLP
ncbi:MAG: hypothetical protein ACJAZF_001055 [Granulosicoccus sp.]|jgi:hypothetical protein